jgi:hypothetical protein
MADSEDTQALVGQGQLNEADEIVSAIDLVRSVVAEAIGRCALPASCRRDRTIAWRGAAPTR